MSQQTHYYCDHCTTEVSSHEDLIKAAVSVHIKGRTYPDTAYKEICEKCVLDLGFPDNIANRIYSSTTNKNFFNIIKTLFGGGK